MSSKNQVFSLLSAKAAAQESLGVKNQAWQPSGASPHSLNEDLLSLDWLRAQPDLPVLVQVLPAQRLYQLIQKEGLEEAEEIVEWIRGDQLVRVFDFELWRQTTGEASELAELVVSASVFLDWVRTWNQISPDFAADRFQELEEETMVLLANALFEIVPVGLENGREGSDDYFLTPDSKFYLKIKSSISANTEDEELAFLFVRSLFASNMSFAGRIFSYAAMLVRAEAECDALELRRGRLADEGFVAKEEALALVRPRKLAQWNEQFIATCIENEAKVVSLSAHAADAIDPEIFDRVHAFWRLLPTEDYLTAARSLLGENELLKLTGVENPPDYILETDDKVRIEASERSVRNSMKKLQTLALLSLKQTARQETQQDGSPSQDTALLLIDRVLLNLAEEEPLKVLQVKQRMARLANALASLMEDPASADAQARALSILRGNLNLGLQWLFAKTPSLQTMAQAGFAGSLMLQEATALAEAAELFALLGVERVFQAGVDLLYAVSEHAAKQFDALLQISSAQVNEDADLEIKTKGRLQQLLNALRFAELRQVLWGLELESEGQGAFDALDLILARCLLNRFAFFPLALNSSEVREALLHEAPIQLLRLQAESKVFETCAEISTVLRVLNRQDPSRLDL